MLRFDRATRGFAVGSLWGMPVRLSVAWPLLGVLPVALAAVGEGALGPMLGVLALHLAAVLLHELGHAAAARALGQPPPMLVLAPFFGPSWVPHPPRPGAALLVAGAGPALSLLLGWASLGLVLAWGEPSFDLQAPAPIDFLAAFALSNLLVATAHLLPFAGLDGGRLLQALAWFAVGPTHGRLFAGGVGLTLAVGGVGWSLHRPGAALVLVACMIGGYRCMRDLMDAHQDLRREALPDRRATPCPRCGEPLPLDPRVACACGHQIVRLPPPRRST